MLRSILFSIILTCLIISISSATEIPAGPVSGDWDSTGNPYNINGNISISTSQTLTIRRSVEVIFQGHYNLIVHGTLKAFGTENDSILFTATDASEGWDGIHFDEVLSGDTLLYCIFQHARPTTAVIYCFLSNPFISNCHMRWNSDGPVIFCYAISEPTIQYCRITNNSGTAIYCDMDANPTISNCYIYANSTQTNGGGIYCGMTSSPTIEYCTIAQNVANLGGGIYLELSSATIKNCTISGNLANVLGSGIYSQSSFPVIVNTIVEGHRENGGIYFFNGQYASVTYGNFYNNDGQNFIGDPPSGVGEIISVNINGDSCDIHNNIFENPLFVNPATGNYHLQSGSPCIDAGDPTYPYDPDSTIADIGAFYFHHSGINDPREIPQPEEFHLSQNYPNPFNPTTVIPFELPYATHVSLKIYNILGRQVETLIDSRLTSGHHTATFDATHLPSGIYFYELTTTNFHDIKKMILLK